MGLARIVLVFYSAALADSLDTESTCDALNQDECGHQVTQARSLLQMTPKRDAGSLEVGHGSAQMPPPIALFDGKGGSGAMTKFMELERRVRQMHAEGQSPGGIQAWIQQQLLPMANHTKSQLQGEVNRAQQAVDDCATNLAAAENGASEQETTLSIGESRHNECELEMAQKSKRAQDDCVAVQALIDTLQPPPSVASVDLNSTAAVEDALQANFHFFEQEYPTYMDEDAHCVSATTLAQEQEQQCDADKSNLESSYCSLQGARQQICSDYDACFVEKTALFDRAVSDVKLVEANTKSTFQTLTCFSHTIMTDMQNSRPACNATGVDTTYLDVFYPSQPSKESCSEVVSTSWNYTAALCEEQDGGDGAQGAAGAGAGQASSNVSNVNSTNSNQTSR